MWPQKEEVHTRSLAVQTYMAQEAELVVFPPEAAVVSAGRPALPRPTHTQRQRGESNLVNFSPFEQIPQLM